MIITVLGIRLPQDGIDRFNGPLDNEPPYCLKAQVDRRGGELCSGLWQGFAAVSDLRFPRDDPRSYRVLFETERVYGTGEACAADLSAQLVAFLATSALSVTRDQPPEATLGLRRELADEYRRELEAYNLDPENRIKYVVPK